MDAGLVTYTRNGSCNLPKGAVSLRELGGELLHFSGSGYEFVGKLEVAQADARQLAARRRGELDPADYEMFLLEYRKLTDKQRLVIDDMGDGLTPQRSADHLNYQKSTVYSYRRDIYDKLNITGKDKLQQLRLRVALLRQEEQQETPVP